MRNSKLLCKLLHLTELKVTWIRFENRGKDLCLGVKPFKNGCRCPECGRRGRIARTAGKSRTWTDLTILGRRISFAYAPKEIICPTHGRIQEDIPWAAAHSRVTWRLEYRICAFCQIMTQKAAATILQMSTSTLSDILHRVIQRTPFRAQDPGLDDSRCR